MPISAMSNESTLPQFLAARARRASDARLVADTVGGILVILAMITWRPTGWLLVLSVAAYFAAFGSWGITDRELRERPREAGSRMEYALRGGRLLAVAAGGVAAASAAIVFLALALGTLIS